MADATEAPASITAEGPTSHTQNQGAALLNGLDPDQILMLREAIEAWRVGDDGKGHSAMEQWDVRRTLLRIFGIGGFDIIQITPPELVAVQETPNGNAPPKYTVIYRALSRLVIRNRRGQQLAVFEDGAIDEGLKQPSLTQAHDQGYKGAMSSALKRCAMNLGDQFGLSLYNKGSVVPVVYTPAERYRDMAVAAWNDFDELTRINGMAQEDDVLSQKVWNYDRTRLVALGRLLRARGMQLKPTQETAPADTPPTADSVPARPVRSQPEHTRPAESQPKVTLAEFRQKVTRVWKSLDGTRQNLLEAEKTGLADEVVPVGDEGTPTRIRELLENRIAELEAAKRGERSAA
jgi:hypothetical protein